LPRIGHEKSVDGYFAANSASLLESVVEDVVTRGSRVQETIDIVHAPAAWCCQSASLSIEAAKPNRTSAALSWA
jgi:orotate phosphoribosyltransferase-like protein